MSSLAREMPSLRQVCFALALLTGANAGLQAQSAPAPSVDATTLARYDKNKNGVLDPDEVAAMNADQQKDAAAVSAAAADKPQDEIVALSPFEVVTDTRGYYAANSMSGTRFNTKLEDLASSLTVVTKEQMQDFAMLDINDIFLYTASTEGTGTYTDYVMDRNGQLTDNVQMNPTQANRVRGIAAANVSLGNYDTMGRTPVDPTVVEGVEVSRGPNANVFGLGNPSGTVNQVPASANMSRDRSHVDARVDSYDGYRTSLDVNRVLLKNRLAVRASGAFQHEGFVRKPSGVNTVRYNAMVKAQPFKTTTISASYFFYRMNGNRPNYTPPRDYVSDWVAAGKPGWDPVLQVVHLNGQTIGNGGLGTTAPITADANVPAYFTRAGTIQTRSNIYVDQNGIAYWTTPSTNNPASNPFTPAANSQSVRLMESGVDLGARGASLGRSTVQPLFTTTPSVYSKSMYDWSSINLSSVNRLMDKTETYNVSLDQLFFNTPRQTLAAQLGFFREDAERYQRTPIGNAGVSGQSGQLFIDVNEKNLDGTPNPFFGRPFIGVTEPITKWLPAKWDTYRVQAAYRLDLRKETNLLKWLGLQQLSGYDEYKYRINRSFGYRDVLSSDAAWTTLAANQARANQSGVTGGLQSGPNIYRGYYRYYVGDANGANVDYAPGDFKYGSYPFVWGGYTLVNGVPTNSGTFVRDPMALTQLATTDSTGGNNNLKQIIKTPGAVLQSYFLNGNIVTTLGRREDKVYSKNGYAIPSLVDNNTQHDFATDNHWAVGDYRYNVGKTKTAGVVVRPFRDFAFINQAAERGTGVMHYLADAARGLSLTYNRSDNFVPQPPAVDLFLNPLPNTTGEGRDYGFWLNMADGRFVLRFNHYQNTQRNARNGDANTVAQRVLRIDLDVASDAYELARRADAWWRTLHPDWNDAQVRQAVADQMKIPTAQWDALAANFRAGTIAATNDVVAKGNELELNFNPSRYWTVAANATEQRSMSANISSAVQQWIDQRYPIWTTIVDPNRDPTLGTGAAQGWAPTADNPQHLWWLHNYGGSQTPSQNFATFVQAPYSVIKQQEGKSQPSVRRYNFRVSSSYQLGGITENRILRNVKVGGAVRWEDKGAIGYYGKDYAALLAANQPITQLDPSHPIWDKAHAYYDAFLGYRTRMFADKVNANFQLNVRNLQESGRLQAIGAFPDGTPNAYRIVDPRQFIFTASFDL